MDGWVIVIELFPEVTMTHHYATNNQRKSDSSHVTTSRTLATALTGLFEVDCLLHFPQDRSADQNAITACNHLLSFPAVPDDYPFKNFMKYQIEVYGKAVSFLMEARGLEESARDAESRLKVDGAFDRLERMVISVRQLKKCKVDVEKFLTHEMITQTSGDQFPLNPLDLRMDTIFTDLVEKNDCLQDVVLLHGQQLGEAAEESLLKAVGLSRGMHSGPESWKGSLEDPSEIQDVLDAGQKMLSLVNAEELMPVLKILEEAM